MNGKTKKSPSKSRSMAACLVTLTSLSAYGAVDAGAATATMPILAKLIRAIEVTINTSLDFGTIAMTIDRAGRATVDPLVDEIYVDGASSLSLVGGQPRAGRIQIKGADLPVTVSLEDTAVYLINGSTSVVVNDFNFITEAGGAKATLTPPSGDYTITVALGATINTRAGQLTGSYVGSTKIYANYQ